MNELLPSEELMGVLGIYFRADPNITAERIVDIEGRQGNIVLIQTVRKGLLTLRKNNVLSKPGIFRYIIEEELGKFIEGEIPARHVLFLCAQGRLVENAEPSSFNLLVNCESGAGKDWVTRHVVQILPPELYEYRTRISKKAFTYWHDGAKEPEWTWDGKVCYLEDINNDVLNDDTFKVMCSSGSHATIVIEGRAVDKKIEGKPVIFITSATANPKHEMLRRFGFLQLDETEEQTKAIMKRKAEAAAKGKIFRPEYDPAIIEAQSTLLRVKVKVPFAEWFPEMFPSDHIIMRTLFNRFIDWIRASAAFHQFQREKDEDGYFIATGEDYDIAKYALEATTSNRFMIPLTKNQLRILEVADSVTNPFLIDDLAGKVNFIGERQLRRELDKLANFGFLRKESIHIESSNRPVLQYTKNPLGSIGLPSWSELLTIRQFDKHDNNDNLTNTTTPDGGNNYDA